MQSKDVYALQQQGKTIDLIDVRTPEEYAKAHAEGAVSVPLNTLTPDAVASVRRTTPDQPVYIICKSGGRSLSACQKLISSGLGNMVNVDGGTLAWQQAGLPIVRDPSAPGRKIGLIPIGMTLMLLCLTLAFTVSYYFFIAAAGVWIGFMIATRGQCPMLQLMRRCCTGRSSCCTK